MKRGNLDTPRDKNAHREARSCEGTVRNQLFASQKDRSQGELNWQITWLDPNYQYYEKINFLFFRSRNQYPILLGTEQTIIIILKNSKIFLNNLMLLSKYNPRTHYTVSRN